MRSLTHWNRLNSRISAAPRTFLSPPSKKPKKFICQQNLKSGGERSNAAARTAVCRRATVTRAPRSRARLIPVMTRRDSWRSHVHRTYIAQRVQSFKPQACNIGGRGGRPPAFLWGFKRGYSLLRKRIPPLNWQQRSAPHYQCSATRCTLPPIPLMEGENQNAHCALRPLRAMMRPS